MSAKDELKNSRLFPNGKFKDEVLKLVNSNSRVVKGKVFYLTKPSELRTISSKISGCGLGADKNGYFVFTHRARSKSYKTLKSIPKKTIEFIESTG